ncbi:hypothetical protein LS684_22005 (plasmid) [Cytobacillus spongiae]|uniref:hypothetical protein n=1 Tax=Cytobacillus spongiae TaxID=2901381 RepID=UPI00145CABAE|nr:hypothetical protein [Cytobacillus spongiae]MCA1062652.1 hypothetical protein [Rossellomorea aquimaris]NMH69996.1 hypothetical protein [Bacillus sp. RO3]UII58288.1 hypothetical protein LS684_22005 [Cytobacillus spongiae]WJV28683.1 hypothetical protein QTG56_16710 [Rossellomorea sp. AcN35-11]
MNQFFSKYSHWLLLILVGLSFMMGLSMFTKSLQGLIAGIFGFFGLMGVAYLVIHMEIQKRRRANSKK